MLAHKYEEDKDPSGYWISEKLDGVRVSLVRKKSKMIVLL
jgi:ATP-dependent DNA ligase